MLAYLWNKYQAAKLAARYERLVQERLLALAETSGPEVVADDPDTNDWLPVGGGAAAVSDQDRADARRKARELAARNPHAKNALRLLEVYVVGPGLKVEAVAERHGDARKSSPSMGEAAIKPSPFMGEPAIKPSPLMGEPAIKPSPLMGEPAIKPSPLMGEDWVGVPPAASAPTSSAPLPPTPTLPHKGGGGFARHTLRAGDAAREADRLWRDFLEHNRRHWSYREHARRAWRDGECFLRVFPQPAWPPAIRFVDPEAIDDPAGARQLHRGIVTEPNDVETPLAYLHVDPTTRELIEEIPAAEVFHTRLGVDSNQKRGVTIFLPVLDALKRFDGWLETELVARKLQASIVLWRKVRGSPSAVASAADAAGTGSTRYREGDVRREKVRGGTILTTSAGTELQFLHPQTNFADAVPLGRMVLLCIAAGEGLPEFMLTSDAANANYASTLVSEGPAVKLFRAEQMFFIAEFDAIWRWAMREAVRLGLLPRDFFDHVRSQWTPPELVVRDRVKERAADLGLMRAGVLSAAEVARREGVDLELMRAEDAANGSPQ